MTTVVKLGGELLEDASAIERAAESIVRMAARAPLVVVHGGGRAIDAELRARGEQPRFVDGLRITDAGALEAVLSVLAGRTNPSLVAAIGAAGGRAVGLTGADGMLGLSARAGVLRSAAGDDVDLGLVGEPVPADVRLIDELLALGYVPVIASIGVTTTGALLNVNADVFAGHLAAALAAERLIIAGVTPGVLDAEGHPVERLPAHEIDRLIAARTVHSGMVAKLSACRRAVAAGVRQVSIVTGRNCLDYAHAPGTAVVADRALQTVDGG